MYKDKIHQSLGIKLRLGFRAEEEISLVEWLDMQVSVIVAHGSQELHRVLPRPFNPSCIEFNDYE